MQVRSCAGDVRWHHRNVDPLARVDCRDDFQPSSSGVEGCGRVDAPPEKALEMRFDTQRDKAVRLQLHAVYSKCHRVLLGGPTGSCNERGCAVEQHKVLGDLPVGVGIKFGTRRVRASAWLCEGRPTRGSVLSHLRMRSDLLSYGEIDRPE